MSNRTCWRIQMWLALVAVGALLPTQASAEEPAAAAPAPTQVASPVPVAPSDVAATKPAPVSPEVASPEVAPQVAAAPEPSVEVEAKAPATAEEDATSSEASGATPLQVHGFVSEGFIQSTKNNYLGQSSHGSFDFTEVGINFTKGLTDDLRVGVQLFARDLGRIGNYKPSFDWYYLDYHFKDWLGFRAGRTKIPFGLYNETNDIDAARVPVLLPQSVYPVQNRDYLLAQTGAEIYGFVSLGEVGRLEYRGYGGTIFLDTSGATTSPTGTLNDLRVPYLIGGRLMWLTPIKGLQVGGSLQALRLDVDFTPNAQTLALIDPSQIPAGFKGLVKAQAPALLWVGSVEYAVGDLLLASEISRWRVKSDSNFLTIVPKTDTVSDRFYVMGSYRLAPWFAPGLYYSALFPKSGRWDQRGDYQHDVAFSARFDITQNWLIKAEAHVMHGTAALDPSENNNVPLNQLTRDWGLFLLKTTAYF